MNALERLSLYMTFGCLTRRGFERRCTKLLNARNDTEDGEPNPLHPKLEQFFETQEFQHYWIHEWRHFWKAVGTPSGRMDIGLMNRADALRTFRESSVGARVLYVDDIHHHILYSTRANE